MFFTRGGGHSMLLWTGGSFQYFWVKFSLAMIFLGQRKCKEISSNFYLNLIFLGLFLAGKHIMEKFL